MTKKKVASKSKKKVSKKKLKSKPLSLTMDAEYYMEHFSSKKPLPKKLVNLIDNAAKDINEHFASHDHPWDLNASLYKNEIVMDFLGFDINAELLKKLNKGIQIVINSRGIFYTSKRSV